MDLWKSTNLRKVCPFRQHTATMQFNIVLRVRHNAMYSYAWEIFSEQFYREFFRRYPEDPVLFEPRRFDKEEWDTKFVPSADPDDEINGWFLRTVFGGGRYRFYNPTENVWVYSKRELTIRHDDWRVDERIHELVEEMGEAAAAPHMRLFLTQVPVGGQWRIYSSPNGEELEFRILLEPILAELATLARGETPESPSQFLKLFQDGTVKTVPELIDYVTKEMNEVNHWTTPWDRLAN